MYFMVIIFIMPTAKYLLMSCHILIYKYIVSKYININVSNRKEIGGSDLSFFKSWSARTSFCLVIDCKLYKKWYKSNVVCRSRRKFI